MSDAFRVATTSDSSSVAGSPTSRSNVSTASSNLEPGLYTYATVKGHPYGIKHFDLKLFHESGNYPELADKAAEVDAWITAKAKERHLEDSSKSYDEILKEIYKQIGKSDSEESFSRFNRVAAYIQAVNRMKEAKLPPVIDNMTANEIKEISEN
jgi:hypothetical protein